MKMTGTFRFRTKICRQNFSTFGYFRYFSFLNVRPNFRGSLTAVKIGLKLPSSLKIPPGSLTKCTKKVTQKIRDAEMPHHFRKFSSNRSNKKPKKQILRKSSFFVSMAKIWKYCTWKVVFNF